MMKRLWLPIAVPLLVSIPALAQTSLKVELTETGARTTARATSGGKPVLNGRFLDVLGDVNLEIRCSFACDDLEASLDDDVILTLDGDGATRRTEIPGTQIGRDGTNLIISRGRRPVFGVELFQRGVAGITTQSLTRATAADACSDERLQPNVRAPHFLITPGGSIQDQTTEPIDEDDRVTITVISTDAALLRSLEVTRTSGTRTTGTLVVIGGGVRASDLQRRLFVDEPDCFIRTFELGDFAPGEAVVDISARDGAKRTSIGTLRFNVNRLYDGIISLGPAWTNVADREFGLAPQGSDRIIIETEDGGDDVLYTAMYTHFLRQKRDIEKPKPPLRQRINPTIGFSVNQPTNHALAGVSIDGGQFVLTLGLHAARVKRLSEDANVKLGDKFAGTVTEIPTERKWQGGVFFGITVDARAVRLLLDAITPGN